MMCDLLLAHSHVTELNIDLSEQNKFSLMGSLQHKKGTLLDLLACQKDRLKIVNTLDFPMPCTPHPPTAIASDVAAFLIMVDLPLCGHSIPFPMVDWVWLPLMVLSTCGIQTAMDSEHTLIHRLAISGGS
jgi:hypothetical protein